MANLSGATNTLHVSVGLLTAAVYKTKNEQIKAINADPTLTTDEKELAVKKLEQSKANAAIVAYGVNMAINAGKTVADYYISDIGRRNGDSNYQKEIDRVTNNASRVMNVIMGVGSSTAAGFAVGGVPGALIMGAISAVGQGISYGFEIKRQNREYAHEMFKDNQRIEVLKQRASLADYNGRIR